MKLENILLKFLKNLTIQDEKITITRISGFMKLKNNSSLQHVNRNSDKLKRDVIRHQKRRR